MVNASRSFPDRHPLHWPSTVTPRASSDPWPYQKTKRLLLSHWKSKQFRPESHNLSQAWPRLLSLWPFQSSIDHHPWPRDRWSHDSSNSWSSSHPVGFCAPISGNLLAGWSLFPMATFAPQHLPKFCRPVATWATAGSRCGPAMRPAPPWEPRRHQGCRRTRTNMSWSSCQGNDQWPVMNCELGDNQLVVFVEISCCCDSMFGRHHWLMIHDHWLVMLRWVMLPRPVLILHWGMVIDWKVSYLCTLSICTYTHMVHIIFSNINTHQQNLVYRHPKSFSILFIFGIKEKTQSKLNSPTITLATLVGIE